MDTRFFMPLCMSRRFACSFLCAFGDILNSYTFAGVGGVVVTVIRDLNDTHEMVF